MIGKPQRARKGGTMIGITAKAAAILERLIGDTDLHTADVTIDPLKIHYISPISGGTELISVGFYYEEADGLMADPEFVFGRSEQGEMQKNGKYFEGGAAPPMYFPVSYRADTFAIDKKCVWIEDDTFNRREQKKIAKTASKWIQDMVAPLQT